MQAPSTEPKARCLVCHHHKPLSEFRLRKGGGRMPNCKSCRAADIPGYKKAYQITYRKKHPQYLSDLRARHYADSAPPRRERRRLPTPAWANQEAIDRVYTMCRELSDQLKRPYTVDHIVPLVSPVVCGLHVEYNLRVIPAATNASKSNQLMPELLEEHDHE